MVDIAWEAVTFPGPDQYAQDVIGPGSAGTTYTLKAGVHRGQTLTFKDGDTLVFEEGAELAGCEDVSGGWAQSGGLYRKALSLGGTSTFGNSKCRAGYVCGELDMLIVDGRLLAWKTSSGAVDEYSAYHDGTYAYILGNPSGKLVEISREYRAIVGEVSDVTIKADNTAEGGGTAPATFFGRIYGYSCDVQRARTAVYGGYDLSDPYGPQGDTGWLYQDLIIGQCAGTAFRLPTGGTTRRVHVVDNGQLGHTGADDTVVEYSSAVDNNSGGWSAGWEGGNNKFAFSHDGVVKGSFYALWEDHPNVVMTGVLWFDIQNDGMEIYDNMLIDRQGSTYRGLFWEISYSAQMIRNICHGLARDAEGDGWSRGIIASESGPVLGVSRWDKLTMQENVVYKCGGGPGGVENGPRAGGSDGPYNVKNLDVIDNIVYFDHLTAWTEETGTTDWNSSYTPVGIDYDGNVYFVASETANRWQNSVVGGSGSADWDEWQSDGQDPNGLVVTQRVHPSGDPDPFNGGCMVGAGGF